MLPIDKFETSYSTKDRLPLEQIDEVYDRQIFELFSQGKEIFFSPLRKDYPEIYDFLIKKCSDLYLTERRAISSADYSYIWTLATSNTYLKSDIPFGYRLNNVCISEEEFYEALPEYLKPFYFAFNGFDIDENPHARIECSGFLRSMSNWPSVDESLSDRTSQKAMTKYIKQHYPDSDLRVICFGLQEDALVIDVENQYPGLFQVKSNPISFELLDKPVDYITDIFFENFPEINRK